MNDTTMHDKNSGNVIVVWSTYGKSDHWQVFQDGTPEANLKDAQAFYSQLCDDETTYTASICVVTQSTDYSV